LPGRRRKIAQALRLSDLLEVTTRVAAGDRTLRHTITHWEGNVKVDEKVIQAVVIVTLVAIWGEFVWCFWTLV
jgi:hypothetical protein